MKRILQITYISLCLLLIAGCSQASDFTPTATAPVSIGEYQPLDQLLVPAQAGKRVLTIGYYYLVGGDAVLIDGLSFAGGRPQPLSANPARQLWIGEAPVAAIASGLQDSGDAKYAPVLATGKLEGPGAYGPKGSYIYQLAAPQVSLLTPLDLTVPALLSKALTYDGKFVRVSGTLLARTDSALLVDRVGAGGVPPANAHQLKLTQPFRDQALWESLPGNAGGFVRYGPVQIEGFWRDGVLTPFGIVPGEGATPSPTPT